MAIRWALMSVHYTSDRMWNEATLSQAQESIAQLRHALAMDVCAPTQELIVTIIGALSNDLDTPLVLSKLSSWSQQTLRGSQGGDSTELKVALDALLGMVL